MQKQKNPVSQNGQENAGNRKGRLTKGDIKCKLKLNKQQKKPEKYCVEKKGEWDVSI